MCETVEDKADKARIVEVEKKKRKRKINKKEFRKLTVKKKM